MSEGTGSNSPPWGRWALMAGAALGALALGGKRKSRGSTADPSEHPDVRRALEKLRKLEQDFNIGNVVENTSQFAEAWKEYELALLRAQGASDQETRDKAQLLDLRLAGAYPDEFRRTREALERIEGEARDVQRELAGRNPDAAARAAAKACQSCKGAGKYLCPRCHGTAREQTRNYYGQLTWIPCTNCGGSGTLPCRICNGTGRRA